MNITAYSFHFRQKKGSSRKLLYEWGKKIYAFTSTRAPDYDFLFNRSQLSYKDYHYQMCALSEQFPLLCFVITCKEENGDRYRIAYHEGRHVVMRFYQSPIPYYKMQ